MSLLVSEVAITRRFAYTRKEAYGHHYSGDALGMQYHQM